MENNAPRESTFQSDWLPSFLIGVLMLTSSVTTFFLPVYLSEQLGFSGGKIGILFAFQAIAGILVIFPVGLGNDRVTSRTLVGASLLFLSAFFILIANARVFLIFLVVYFCWTACYHMFRLSLDVQVLKTDSGQKTGGRIGLYQAWRFGGIGLGTVVSGYLLESLDFSQTFFIAAIICLALILPSRKLLPTPVERTTLSQYRADFRNPKVIFFAVWLLLFSTHWGAEYTSYGLFLRKDMELSMIEMGWYMSAEFFAILLTALFVGRKLKGTAWLTPVSIAGLVFSGTGHIGMVFKPLAVSFAFRAMHGIGDGLIFLVFYVGIAKLFQVHRIGGNAGLMNLSTMIGMIIGALVTGPVGERFGYAVPLWSTGIITLILIIPLLWMPKWPEKVEAGN